MLPSSPESLVARAQLRWPGLALPAEDFACYLRERYPSQDPDPSILDDLFLAFGCAQGDPVALAFFERQLLPAATQFLERRERDPAVVEETRQRLRVRVLVAAPGERPRIAEYRGQGSLSAWLRVVAVRLHTDIVKGTRAGSPLDEEQLPSPAVALLSPELATDHDRLLPLFRQAFHQATAALPPRDRTLLRLHYIDGLALEVIGTMYRVNKGTVSRWLAAIRARLQDEVLAALQQTSGASPEETRSLLRVLQSRIDLSLRGLREDIPGGI